MRGFTKDHLPNPGEMMSVGDAERLLQALKGDVCKWVPIGQKEWDQVKGKSKKQKKKKSKSPRTVDSDTDDDDQTSPSTAATITPDIPSDTEPMAPDAATSVLSPGSTSPTTLATFNAASGFAAPAATPRGGPAATTPVPPATTPVPPAAAAIALHPPSDFDMANIDPALRGLSGSGYLPSLGSGTGHAHIDRDGDTVMSSS